MSFLIPAARPNPSATARFGRLLHWCALALAAVFLVLALEGTAARCIALAAAPGAGSPPAMPEG